MGMGGGGINGGGDGGVRAAGERMEERMRRDEGWGDEGQEMWMKEGVRMRMGEEEDEGGMKAGGWRQRDDEGWGG